MWLFTMLYHFILKSVEQVLKSVGLRGLTLSPFFTNPHQPYTVHPPKSPLKSMSDNMSYRRAITDFIKKSIFCLQGIFLLKTIHCICGCMAEINWPLQIGKSRYPDRVTTLQCMGYVFTERD